MKIVISLIPVAFFAYLMIGGIIGARNRRRHGNDPNAPANLDPLVRGWRRRRFNQGKSDNWLTRTHVQFDGSGRGPFVKFFPKTTAPSRAPRSMDADQRESKGPGGG
ncbi:hypothetical protein [Micromonospora globispora]|uniref:hypothetical protein n=1 Tax=Micromonospora globispora TaxID=1450148 RepID=UPI000F4FDF61|nr:hypothetical protein [Micromonospora globispora]